MSPCSFRHCNSSGNYCLADVERILARIRELSRDPRPPGSEKLSTLERYRVRQGKYRILYSIESSTKSQELIVVVVKVAHRRDVYRQG